MTSEEHRRLDAEVAKKVMGWGRYGPVRIPVVSDGDPTHVTCLSHPERGIVEIPHYSTDIAAAWEVVEKFLAGKHDFTLDSGRNRTTGEVFHACRIDDVNLVYAPTAPHAICLAALKAVGVEV